MIQFREYYAQRHGIWPAYRGEPTHEVMKRIAETMADFADVLAKSCAETGQASPKGCDTASHAPGVGPFNNETEGEQHALRNQA